MHWLCKKYINIWTKNAELFGAANNKLIGLNRVEGKYCIDVFGNSEATCQSKTSLFQVKVFGLTAKPKPSGEVNISAVDMKLAQRFHQS